MKPVEGRRIRIVRVGRDHSYVRRINLPFVAFGALALFAVVAACSSSSSETGAERADSGALEDAASGDSAIADAAIADAAIGPHDAGPADAADAAASSTFTATVDGVPRDVTFLTGHRVPFSNDIGVHARLSAKDDAGADAGFDHILIHLPLNASGVVLCSASLELDLGAAQFVTFYTADAASCEFTGVSIGPLGGFIDGAFTGTVTKRFGPGTHTVSVAFHVLRGADSDFL